MRQRYEPMLISSKPTTQPVSNHKYEVHADVGGVTVITQHLYRVDAEREARMQQVLYAREAEVVEVAE